MLHRAVLGSMERFIGILIENHAGALPTWLSPTQVVVLNITDKFAEYAESVVKKLRDLGIRADIDLRNEKVNFKIREHTLQKVPYLLIVGQKEQETQQVAVRSRQGEDFGAMSLDAFLAKFQAEVNSYQ
jgi:threonyl-tRNA synthetase